MAACNPRGKLQSMQSKRLTRVGSNASLNVSTARQSNSEARSVVKKYKAPLSVEAKTRRMTKSNSTTALDSPRTPSRSRSSTPLPPASPRTPRTPIRSQSRCDDVFMESEMDVSRVDPEQALVDAENVDVDLSFELGDDRELRSLRYGREDKVHVSIR